MVDSGIGGAESANSGAVQRGESRAMATAVAASS